MFKAKMEEQSFCLLCLDICFSKQPIYCMIKNSELVYASFSPNAIS